MPGVTARRGRVRRRCRRANGPSSASASRRDDPAADRALGGTRIYAVASGKGGVGKSTVTANLAVALAATGRTRRRARRRRLGLLDPPAVRRARATRSSLGELMLPVRAHGVGVDVGRASSSPTDQPVVWRGPMLHKALEQFLDRHPLGRARRAAASTCRPAPATSRCRCSSSCPSAALLAVTTPQPTAQHGRRAGGAMARDVGMPIAGVVENMSAPRCASCGRHAGVRQRRRRRARRPGRVSRCSAGCRWTRPLRVAGDAGVPVVLADPDAASASALREIAAALRPGRPRSLAGMALPLSPV